MRLAIVLLSLWLAAAAWADDDDGGVLEVPPLGGIPERMQELEREWGEDVGTGDPTPADPHDVDPDVAEAREELKGETPEQQDEPPARPTPPEPVVPKSPPPSALPPALPPHERPSPSSKGTDGKPAGRDATAPTPEE